MLIRERLGVQKVLVWNGVMFGNASALGSFWSGSVQCLGNASVFGRGPPEKGYWVLLHERSEYEYACELREYEYEYEYTCV